MKENGNLRDTNLSQRNKCFSPYTHSFFLPPSLISHAQAKIQGTRPAEIIQFDHAWKLLLAERILYAKHVPWLLPSTGVSRFSRAAYAPVYLGRGREEPPFVRACTRVINFAPFRSDCKGLVDTGPGDQDNRITNFRGSIRPNRSGFQKLRQWKTPGNAKGAKVTDFSDYSWERLLFHSSRKCE